MGDGRPGRPMESLTDRVVNLVMQSQPMTWAELSAQLGESTTSLALVDATRRRSFTQCAMIAASAGRSEVPDPAALVFRLDELPAVAASARLWRLAFRYVRGGSTHLHSAGELRAAFKPAPLKTAFGHAMKAALARRALPAGVAAVLRRGHYYLLLQDDLLTAPVSRPASSPPPGEDSGAAPTTSFAEAFDAVFSRLDHESGGKNFVKLLSLRRALAQYPRRVFDQELNALRRAGQFSLDAAEGTHDRTTPEEREAGVVEAGRRLLYCARR